MDGNGASAKLPWWEEGNTSWTRVSEETSGGRLGEAPLLRNSLCRPECPPLPNDRSREIQTGPLLGDQGIPPVIRSKRYHLLDDCMLQDPFDPRESSSANNKTSNLGFYDEPPCLFPAFTTSAPPRLEKNFLTYTHS